MGMVIALINNYSKGDLFLLNNSSYNKNVYLYIKNIEIEEEGEEKDEDIKKIDQSSEIIDECEGKVVNLFKNNLVVEIDDNGKSFIKEGEKVYIKVIQQNKAYECLTKILGLKSENNKLTLVLSIPIFEKEVDRRRFFRINSSLTVRYCILPKGEYRNIIDVPKGCFLKTKKTMTTEISGGGIRILSKEKCEADDYVLLTIFLPEKIDVLCKVIRIEEYRNQSLLCMKYICIDEIYRDKIIEFVFKTEAAKISRSKEN